MAVISVLKSDLQQACRDKYQVRLMNDLLPTSISNQVARKIWYGHISPGCPGRLANPVCSHGKRYLQWDVVFTWDNGTFSGSLHSYGSFGRYSGAVIAAQCDITDTNPNLATPDFHGPSAPIACGSITSISSAAENKIHMAYDTSLGPAGSNPICTGTMDVTLTQPYTYTDLQVDCRDLYLTHDISSVPDNAWRLAEWEIASNSQAQNGWLGSAYEQFAHGPCAGQPAGYAGIDTRFNWPVANPTYNGGAMPGSGYNGPGSVNFSWPTMADYRLLVETLDTSGYLQGNALSQLFSGTDTGLWTMIGALYRHMKSDHHCVKTRVTGVHFDAGTGNVVNPALDNVDICTNVDNNRVPRKTFYIDAPFITINADNNQVDVYADPNFTLRASAEMDGSCNCVGKPSPPFGVSAVNGGGVIVLNWSVNASDHVINVKIFRSETPGTEGLLATWGGSTTYIDSLVTTGHTYYYKLKAVNAWGESDYSVEVSASL